MAYGYNLKPYYELMYCFYKYIDETLADYYFQEYEKLETDGNGNCKACNRNFEIQYYLKKGNETKAKQLAKDIENHTLNCGGNGENSAWRQLKITYLIHYLEQGDLKQATGIMEEILKNNQYDKKLTMFNNWHIFLWYYTHIDIGKALQIYKKHWKKWQQEREPYKKFYYFVDNILFFRELKKQRKGEKIKLDLDDTMPIFREDRTYRIVDLLEFYHQQAEELARRFDERNGTCFYQKELEWYLNKEI